MIEKFVTSKWLIGARFGLLLLPLYGPLMNLLITGFKLVILVKKDSSNLKRILLTMAAPLLIGFITISILLSTLNMNGTIWGEPVDFVVFAALGGSIYFIWELLYYNKLYYADETEKGTDNETK